MLRNAYAHFAGLFVLSLLVSGQGFTESQEKPDTTEMLRKIQDLSKDISAMKNRLEMLNNLTGIDERVVGNIVVMTEQNCDVLGPDWKNYQRISGRFPIGAGENSDVRGDQRTFEIGQDGGEYSHQLTLDEMTKHRHKLEKFDWGHSVQGNNHPARINVDDGRPWEDWKGSLVTTESGENQPHNNIPPYVVMNFCQKLGSSVEHSDP